MIEIAEHLNTVTKQLLGRVMECETLSILIKNDAKALIERAESINDQVSDNPSLEILHIGILDLRMDLTAFIQKLSVVSD